MNTSKSGKREVACVFLALVLVHAGYITIAVAPEHLAVYIELNRVFAWPATLMLAWAFGMDWASKSGLIPPQSN
jgi:hypothetical protein